MQAASGLPKMAGTGYGELMSKDTFAKTKAFDFMNGMPVVSEGEGSASATRASVAKLSLPVSQVAEQTMSSTNQPFTPGFVSLDRKVLRFSAWLEEKVLDNPYESCRIHKCTILYYLVDDSMQVSEPKTLNAAMPQGTYLKRHRIPREGNPDSWLSWKEIQVGGDLTMYGRVFHISDCDSFTREFYLANGIEQAAAEGSPADEYTERRMAMTKKPQRLPRYIDWNLRKKLNNPFAKKCLRFFACWDDRDNTFGEKRPFVVNFFLEDETLEVLEVHAPNDGRENFPRMLKRQKVPKQFAELADTYGPHITAADLMVGGHLMVFGRQFFLYACDDSTKEFMKTNFDLTDEDFPDLVDSVLEADEPLPEMPVPPHTGIGDPEDSLQSVYNLVPRPPRRDTSKLLKFEGKVIRWKATLNTTNPDDEGRVFVISFNLADDTMSIFEPPIKNSGIVGGSFMSREKVWKPGCKFQETYCLDDFKEGNIIVAHGHEFVLQESDAFTKKLLVQIETGKGASAVDAGAFSTMDPEEAMKMFRQKLSIRNKRAFWQFARIIDKDHSGTISMDEMWEGCKLFNVDITREDMESILRRFDKDGNGQIDYLEMANFMGEELG